MESVDGSDDLCCKELGVHSSAQGNSALNVTRARCVVPVVLLGWS